MKYFPEGVNDKLLANFKSFDEVKEAIRTGQVYEGRVIMCDREHNLHIDLGGFVGIIYRSEGALGVLEGEVRDIALISKVGRFVCFKVIGFRRNDSGKREIVLSRRLVQYNCKKEYIDSLSPGDIISARVTRLEGFGAFIDIGAGINSLIPIDMLSVSRISHPRERLKEGQLLRCALRKREDGKLTFTLKELLGTWEQNAAEFTVGETVKGVVRSVESYGIFVELAPNLAGLAESNPKFEAGQRVSVFIKSIIPEKMKVKLVIVDSFSDSAVVPLKYYITEGKINAFRYSPECSEKLIETVF